MTGISLSLGIGSGTADSGPDTPPCPTAAVTTTDTITHRGVTFTLDRPMPVCFSCLGEPAVISDQSFAITAISPASTAVAGSSQSYIAHGTMLNPGDLVISGQGFDEIIADGSSSGQGASATPYVPSLNIDPGQHGPIAFAAGAEDSVVKCVRRGDVTNPGPWYLISRYVVLSILPTVPPVGFFRPGTAPGPKVVHGCETDMRWSVLRSLPRQSGGNTIAQAEAAIIETLPFFGLSNGERLRRIDVEAGGPSGSNYSRDFGLTRADALAVLHEDYTQAEKRLVMLRAVQHGIDLHQAYTGNASFTGEGGAGQNYGRAFFSYVAAFALNSAPLLASAQAMGGGALRQHFWVDGNDIEESTGFPASNSEQYINEAPLLTSDLGIPEWSRGPDDQARKDASPRARYREMYPAGMIEALNIALLQNGPGGVSGTEAILQGGAFDASNPFAAGLAFYDRTRPRPNVFFSLNFLSAPREARWDAWRPLMGLPLWTGRPDWVDGTGQVIVGPGSGEVTYNWAAHTWATEPITRRDIRYSLDRVQWITQEDVPGFGTLSGLTPGLPHHVSYRIVSASGPGRWSPTYPRHGTQGAQPNPRNVVTPSGTPANAAPVNTVAPLITVREVEDWPGSDMISAGTAYSQAQWDDQIALWAGVGYWTGFPAPSFSYQWRRDGVDIAGETSAMFQPTPADSNSTITCQITATNAEGSVSVVTQAVAVPTLAYPGISLDFTVSDESAGWVPRNGAETVTYNPTGGPGGNGELTVQTVNAWDGVLAGPFPVISGVEYMATFELSNRSNNRTVFCRLGRTFNNDEYGTIGGINPNTTSTVSGTFTTSSENLYIQIFRQSSGASDFGVIRVSFVPV